MTSMVMRVSGFAEDAMKCLVSTLKGHSCQVADDGNSSGFSARKKCHSVVGHCFLPCWPWLHCFWLSNIKICSPRE